MTTSWESAVDAHRSAVRDATVEATAALVARGGFASLTMSEIAREAGIGRATLYRYFSDIESILVAWHQRQIAEHLEELGALLERPGEPVHRLRAVLDAYAVMAHEHEGTELAALLHRTEHVRRARDHLVDLIAALVAEGAETGAIRSDVPSGELARYCLHALAAAAAMPSKAAVRRLIDVTVAGLRPAD